MHHSTRSAFEQEVVLGYPKLFHCAVDLQVNLHHSHSFAVVETTKPENGFLTKQLCIAHENNADLGQFFADPAPAVETDLATVASQLSAFSFGKTAVSAISSGGSSTFQVKWNPLWRA